MQTLSFQLELCPEIPNVYGALDYRMFRDTLVKINEILIKGGLEHDLVCEGLSQYILDHKLDSQQFYNSKESSLHYKYLKYALRCNIARHLTGESYRAFSLRLADSGLFQWFSSISAFGSRKAISKSSLERYEKYFDELQVTSKIREWLSRLADNKQAIVIGLTEVIDLKDTWMDSTCLEANIHYPVDWVLLRDATRSLLSAIKTIRAQGLSHRMPAPASFMKQMNKLCMEMTHARRRADSKKQRKRILSQLLKSTIERLEKNYGSFSSISTDRAFASAKNDNFLETKNIYNATCPRSPVQLQERLREPLFVSLQTRRSQTEARIGIFKNVFLGKPLRTRIALNKRHAINWCVLTHNLWVLARKIIADEKEQLEKAA